MSKVNLIHEQLSYQLRGIFYKVHNELGQYRNEKQYSDAIEYYLQQAGLGYFREKTLPKSFAGERWGRNRVDFVVEDKVIVEVKALPAFTKENYWQCQRYLVSSGKKLALLVNFRLKSCVIKRILNLDLLNQ